MEEHQMDITFLVMLFVFDFQTFVEIIPAAGAGLQPDGRLLKIHGKMC